MPTWPNYAKLHVKFVHIILRSLQMCSHGGKNYSQKCYRIEKFAELAIVSKTLCIGPTKLEKPLGRQNV